MIASDIIQLLRSARLSPEQIATYFSVSNMTVRRWTRTPDTVIPLRHQSNIIHGVYRMVSEGTLPNDTSVESFLSRFDTQSAASLNKLPGFDVTAFSSGKTDSERIMSGMRNVGTKESTQSQVVSHLPRIKTFRKLGKSWKSAIDVLINVIQNRRFSVKEKWAAFGSLFYLISVIDVVPDFVPIFGLVDDLAVLTIVVAHYAIKKR